jgi:vancomycin resistance protein YoaR
MRCPPQPSQSTASEHADGAARRGRRPGRLALVAAVSGLALLLLPFALDRAMHWGKVLRGVWVGDVALSGLDDAEASRAVEQLAGRLRATTLQVRVRHKLVRVEPAAVGFRVDVPATVAQAQRAGRNGSPPTQLWWWLERWLRPARLAPFASLDPRALDKTLSKLEAAAISDPPFEGGVRAQDGRATAEYPRRGSLVDRQAAQQVVLAGLTRETRSVVELPLREVTPTLERSEVDRAVAEAERLVARPVQLVSADGRRRVAFGVAELSSALRSRTIHQAKPQLRLFFDPVVLDRQLDAVRPDLEREPRDASFAIDRQNHVDVVPSEPGVRLRSGPVASALLQAATSRGRIGLLPLDRTSQPRLRTDEAVALGITKLVSSFTTYHPCCRPRVENIHRIADLLNGTVVKPGETLSVNQVVGPRTRQNGFVLAPTIEEGEMVDSVGGGISQFATTLFNAVFHGGYDIIERQPHSYYFSRYPMGHEATLSYPKPDLVFRNDSEAGLLIVCEYGKTFIRVRLFGDNGGRQVKAKVSNRTDIREPEVELVANPALDPEQEEVLEAGSPGWTVTVARIIEFSDGTKKEEKRKVTYSPRVRRVEVHPCRIPEGEEGYTGEPCWDEDAEDQSAGEPAEGEGAVDDTAGDGARPQEPEGAGQSSPGL